MIRGGSTTLPATTSLAGAALTTAGYAAAAGVLATLLALPVALLAVRQPRRSTMLLERGTFIVQAIPGLVIALALVYFSIRAVPTLYQSAPLLIVGYAIMFFPLALVAVRTSVAQAPLALEDVARSLGRRPVAVWWRVVLPLVGPGLAAAFCLVFLSVVTELTLTLVMIPTGVQTLSTQFWAYTTNLSYAAAAPYAGLMILIAAVPSYILGRWFDRLPSRARHGVSGLEVEDLHKSFGTQPVLTGVDLTVPEGSLTAVLGPSGSGKTTLLRVVAGFERADRGRVTIRGRKVEDARHALRPEQRGIGYVPQEGSLFPHLTVAANVAFGVRRSRRKLGGTTDQLLEMVGLSGMGHRYPHQFSGGQQQRVALARALAIRPALVLLDEPFSSLDTGLRASVRADVQDVLGRRRPQPSWSPTTRTRPCPWPIRWRSSATVRSASSARLRSSTTTRSIPTWHGFWEMPTWSAARWTATP